MIHKSKNSTSEKMFVGKFISKNGDQKRCNKTAVRTKHTRAGVLTRNRMTMKSMPLIIYMAALLEEMKKSLNQAINQRKLSAFSTSLATENF